MKKVSVIVPCYNQAEFLNEALESVLQQSVQDWECIIVNDGSLDNTRMIGQVWEGKDTRFKYVEIENGGISNARNFGINKADGEFILPLDADDKISSDYIELAIKEFENDSTVKVVYCKAMKFGAQNGIWNLKLFSLYDLALENMIFCSGLYRKSDWERVGGYDSNMEHGLEDWEFWISMLKNEGTVKQLDIIGFYYRIKSNSRNKTFDEKQKEELYKYISQKHSLFYIEQLGSFHFMENKFQRKQTELLLLTKSKKKIFNLFIKTFFGFNFFKK